MIHTGISQEEAVKLVAKGGRVLRLYKTDDRKPVCDVEANGSEAPPPPPPPPTKESRKAKLELPPVTEEADEG